MTFDVPSAAPGPLEIGEATPDDAAGFGAFLRAAWAESGPDAPGFAGATDEVIDELATPQAFLARLDGPRRRIFVARRGTEVVGFAATRGMAPPDIELAGIVIRRAFAGQGVGRQLVTAATRQAEADGYTRMVVRTETSNEGARRFYEALGFIPGIVTTETVDSTEIDVWELIRDLP